MSFTITIFLTILAISFILLTLGLVCKRIFFAIASGVIFLFLGGFVLIAGIDEISGSNFNETNTYTGNDLQTSYLTEDNETITIINKNTTITTYTTETLEYEPFTNTSFGIILILLSLYILISAVQENKKDENDELNNSFS